MAALLEQTRVALTGRNRKEPDAILFPGSVGGKKKAPTGATIWNLLSRQRLGNFAKVFALPSPGLRRGV